MEPVVVVSSNTKKYQITIVSSAGGFDVQVWVWEGVPPKWIPVSWDAIPDDILKKIVRLILERKRGGPPPPPPQGVAPNKVVKPHG